MSKNNLSFSIYNVSLIILIFISSFIFIDQIRAYVLSNYINDITLQYINVFAIVCLFLIFFRAISNGTYNLFILIVWLLCLMFSLITLWSTASGSGAIMIVLFCYLFPLLIIGNKINKYEFVKIYNVCLNLLNILVVILLITGVYDYLTKGSFQQFLINFNFFNERSQEIINLNLLEGTYRYFSFIGHPLRLAQIFLTFFILNSIFNKYFYIKLNPLIISIVTLFGVTLSNSKAGVLLAIILILFFNSSRSKKEKRFYWIISFIALLVIINTQFFSSTVLERVTNSSNLDGGRTELLISLLTGEIERPFLSGGGLNYSTEVKATSSSGATSFEYPLLMFSYDLGLLSTFFMYLIIMIYPIVKLLLHRNYYLLGLFIILTLDVNSYNGLTNLGDFIIQFSFVIFIILNVNEYITEKEFKNYYKIRWNKKKNNKGAIN
ncbi:hypothetical protein ABER75_00475 [Niallia taxi]|uniref:hypothetical protein n=1 Tax=Niallia taxi TaxID=2499688 RepID=UPI003D2A6705